MGIRDYKGSARAAYLSGDIDGSALTIPTTGLTGWPSGDNGPFFAVINRQKANEEKILCELVNGTDITVLQRGADDTAPQSHASNSVIEHVITATDAREANTHVNDATQHIQVGSGDRPETDLQVGQFYYDSQAEILYVYGADSDWHATTAHPRLEEDLNMQDTFRVVNLVDPVDPQDAATKSWVEQTAGDITAGDAALARDWAIKMDGTVDGTDYSSKYHATEAKSDAADAAASEAAAAEAAVQAGKYAASTAALWEDFDLRYLGAHPAPPTTGNPNPNDPDEPRPPVQEGSLYFNTTDNQMYVYDGTQWIVASSAAINTFDQFEWTATAGQTVFTTNKDMNPTMLQVYVNGVMVSKSDYTAAVRSVTLLEPAMAGDLVQVHSFQEATILSNVITSQDVDYVKVLPFEQWPIADPDDRTLYVVLPEAGKDYGTLWLGSVQIGGAGGGGLEGSPPPPINLRWESDDPAVSSYRKLMWDSGGMGDAGPTIGYGVLPANDAAKNTTITQADYQTMHATITGTEPGVEYAYKVFASNLAGPGEVSDPVTREFPGPAAPTNVRSTADAFVLTWDHSGQSQIVEDGAVTNYEVDQNVNTRISVTINVSQKTATLDPNDYAPDQNYKFRVRAESASGWGDWSDEFVRDFPTPPAPTNVRVEGTTLMWDYNDIDTGPVTSWEFDQTHPAMNEPDSGDPESVNDATLGPVTT